ncbi:hypothetical protein HOO65_020657 [Ceratocystis lukuohia]|uniref:FAD-dependent oxidoreductase-like enzyme n=1 Tax=Ceratocystis lukuohia TaxID=2019550 RepID=A0ABR4MPC5_9PEZI
MASDSESPSSFAANDVLTVPSTPVEIDVLAPIPSSQVTIPSTEDADFQTESEATISPEINGGTDHLVPSSMTPPPSSQKLLPVAAPDIDAPIAPIAAHANHSISASSGAASLFSSSRHSHPFSPPATGGNFKRTRLMPVNGEYIAPAKTQIDGASAEELRAMLHDCIADHSRVKMEIAHHKFQLKLASLQAEDDAQRAAVEHEMALREVETLRNDQNIRQTRRDLSTASESTHAKYLQLRVAYGEAMEDIADIYKKLKTAKKVIRQNQDEILILRESRAQLLNRIRENREHFNMLRSPGGILHGALAPAINAYGAKQAGPHAPHSRATLKQSHGSSSARGSQEHGGEERLAALLQVLEKNSAPATPVTTTRSSSNTNLRHTRNAQSLSSLPSTPMSRPSHKNDHLALLPSIDLVPQTEPPRRHAKATQQFHGVSYQRSCSRESTISVPDTDEELARRAMNFLSRGNSTLTQTQTVENGRQATTGRGDEATRAAAKPKDSADVRGTQRGTCTTTNASTVNESVTERALQLHAKILGPSESSPTRSAHGNSSYAHGNRPTAKQQQAAHAAVPALPVPVPMGAAAEKRKFSEGLRPDPLRDILASPLKKARNGLGPQKRSSAR